LADAGTDLLEWRLASGRASPTAPVFPAHDGGHWEADDWRNFRRRIWRPVAPEGSRPRDLRSSYITVQVYAGRPGTEIAKHAGTSVTMIDHHYASVIANWSGQAIAAADQIRHARAQLVDARRTEPAGRPERASSQSPLPDSNRRPLPYHGRRGLERLTVRVHEGRSFARPVGDSVCRLVVEGFGVFSG
jgi:hypothetical protein